MTQERIARRLHAKLLQELRIPSKLRNNDYAADTMLARILVQNPEKAAEILATK